MFGFLSAPCSTCNSLEHSVYRAHFCGLCNRLRNDYGLPMRFLVNRDATFLSLLGAGLDPTPAPFAKATCCNPLGKPRLVRQEGNSVSYAAAITLCGLKAKLEDEVADRRFWLSGLPVRGLRGILSRPIAKAERYLTLRGFPVESVRETLSGQTLIEKEAADSGQPNLEILSRPSAFSFGKIVAHTGAQARGSVRDSLEDIGQRLGRVIYTMDAFVDRTLDERRGQFNPFGILPGLVNDVPQNLARDMAGIAAAVEQLPLRRHRELLERILVHNLQRKCSSLLAENGRPHADRETTGKKKNKSSKTCGENCRCCDGCDVCSCCDCGNSCGGIDCMDCGCGCDGCCCDL